MSCRGFDALWGSAHAAPRASSQVVGEEPNLPEALLSYSRIAMDRGLWQDAVRSLLRLLAANPSGADAKRLLAKCLQEPGGLALLRKELPTRAVPEQALALGFVATSVKEHGAVAEAAEILGDVAESLPDSAGHALAHAHALETCGRPLEALRALGAFFARAGSKGVRAGPVTVGDFAAAVALPASLAAAVRGSGLTCSFGRRFAAVHAHSLKMRSLKVLSPASVVSPPLS